MLRLVWRDAIFQPMDDAAIHLNQHTGETLRDHPQAFLRSPAERNSLAGHGHDIAASLLARCGVIVRSICRDGSDEDVTGTLQRVPAGRIDPLIWDLLVRQPSLF